MKRLLLIVALCFVGAVNAMDTHSDSQVDQDRLSQDQDEAVDPVNVCPNDTQTTHQTLDLDDQEGDLYADVDNDPIEPMGPQGVQESYQQANDNLNELAGSDKWQRANMSQDDDYEPVAAARSTSRPISRPMSHPSALTAESGTMGFGSAAMQDDDDDENF